MGKKMECIPQNPNVETEPPNMMGLRGMISGRWLGLNEVLRVQSL